MSSIFDFSLKSLRARLRALSKFRKVVGDESGDALIELALVVSLLFSPLLFGTVEMAQIIFDSIEVSNAARAGASWAMTNSTSSSLTAGLTAAAQAEASDFGTNLNVVPNVYWACSTALAGTQYSTLSGATAACTGTSNHPLELIQVSTSTTVTMPIKCPGLPASITLTSSSVTETE
ncbi:MAG: TadE/TadG family type IV pilus assembly protein [Terracidiphilus sp.]|jgi:Flp pilus assembly protein TadG